MLNFSIQYAQALNITEVDFYVSDDIPKDVAKLKIGESITNSSLILSNSSIPLSRETGNIYYSSSIANLNYDSIEFVMAQLMAEDSSLYKMLVNSDRLSVLVMTSSQSTDLCGSTYSAYFPNVAVIDLNCDMNSMQPEMKEKQMIKAYSFPELKVDGLQCGNENTNNKKVILDNIGRFR